ncbi:MAG: hypothetical protein KKF65_06475 [Nanoarchaeota archaeon]|nr:hypothetical protein [Nanoarchaeota archaeon]
MGLFSIWKISDGFDVKEGWAKIFKLNKNSVVKKRGVSLTLQDFLEIMEVKMADLLTRIKPDALQKDLDNLGSQVWRVVNDKKEEFGLVERLRDGSVILGGYDVIILSPNQRPHIREASEDRAVKLAGRYGFDYAMLAEEGKIPSLGGSVNVDAFLVQFYLDKQK